MRTVKNIDGLVKSFNTDEQFLEYVRAIYKENEEDNPYPSEIHWMPENIQQATEYIVEYCPDLELNEDALNFMQGLEDNPIAKDILQIVEDNKKNDPLFETIAAISKGGAYDAIRPEYDRLKLMEVEFEKVKKERDELKAILNIK